MMVSKICADSTISAHPTSLREPSLSTPRGGKQGSTVRDRIDRTIGKEEEPRAPAAAQRVVES